SSSCPAAITCTWKSNPRPNWPSSSTTSSVREIKLFTMIAFISRLFRIGVVTGLLQLILAAAAHAQPVGDDWLQVYPRAEIVEESEMQVADYRLAASAARRVG